MAEKMRRGLARLGAVARGCLPEKRGGGPAFAKASARQARMRGMGCRTGLKGRDVVTSCILPRFFSIKVVTKVVTRRDSRDAACVSDCDGES